MSIEKFQLDFRVTALDEPTKECLENLIRDNGPVLGGISWKSVTYEAYGKQTVLFVVFVYPCTAIKLKALRVRRPELRFIIFSRLHNTNNPWAIWKEGNLSLPCEAKVLFPSTTLNKKRFLYERRVQHDS